MRDSVPSQQRDERVTVRLNQECVFIKAMQEGGDEGGELQSDRLGGGRLWIKGLSQPVFLHLYR